MILEDHTMRGEHGAPMNMNNKDMPYRSAFGRVKVVLKLIFAPLFKEIQMPIEGVNTNHKIYTFQRNGISQPVTTTFPLISIGNPSMDLNKFTKRFYKNNFLYCRALFVGWELVFTVPGCCFSREHLNDYTGMQISVLCIRWSERWQVTPASG